ncbi:hypothetical protein D3C84_1153360 [compost metagenome]
MPGGPKKNPFIASGGILTSAWSSGTSFHLSLDSGTGSSPTPETEMPSSGQVGWRAAMAMVMAPPIEWPIRTMPQALCL